MRIESPRTIPAFLRTKAERNGTRPALRFHHSYQDLYADATRSLTLDVAGQRQLATPVTQLGAGEHTDQVLTSLGLDPTQLRADGVV